ncbi:MAG: RNA polymerase sigma-70 factor [Candidatus Pedobacter colombiensis]|uniref:RNA polymerase sigma-70 factor n=1 Tax=Candidatus Pedobacter colombiensis TaxID=3121371 RepID=A0AAJ6B5S1_9SPHI|nr:RNA polymerase sigma-70 factor [Pedobacter sp.]WEK18405.1 MAG: RNA polymerase sigma-70 factor [Pedobacter sp.]
MNNYRDFSDAELVVQLKAGDHEAYSEIYNRYKYILTAHAYRKLQDIEEAKDIVQELFTNIWSKKDNLNIHSRLDAYLYGTLRNQVLHFMAHQKVITKYTDSLNNYLERGGGGHDSKMVERELLDMFERELAALPAKMRVVFELSRGEGLSHKQIAEQLDISDKTVKKQIHNATKLFLERIRFTLF